MSATRVDANEKTKFSPQQYLDEVKKRQDRESQMAKITFPVTDMAGKKLGSTRFPSESLAKMHEIDSNRKLYKEALEFECGLTNYPVITQHWIIGKSPLDNPPVLTHHLVNSFIGTVVFAYNQHYALELTPDDFWTSIAQAISIHINNDAEKYRHLFVSHEGKKKLLVEGSKYGIHPKSGNNVTGWPGVIKEMSDKVMAEVNADVVKGIASPFSTTGPIEQTAMHCTLLDSMKSYFEYKCCLLCGLPQVTLYGTAKDYASMINRVKGFQKLLPDLDWWFQDILPILLKLKETAAGSPDRDWWNTIVNHKGGGSGPSYLSGWIAAFNPYTARENGKYGRAYREYTDWGTEKFKGVDMQDLITAICTTPFLLDDQLYTMKEYKMQLASGFFGISQNPETLALRPALGWIFYYEAEKSAEQRSRDKMNAF